MFQKTLKIFTVKLIHLHMSFRATTAELSICARDHMSHKAQKCIIWPLTENVCPPYFNYSRKINYIQRKNKQASLILNIRI